MTPQEHKKSADLHQAADCPWRFSVREIRRAEGHALARAGLAPLLKKARWTLLKHRATGMPTTVAACVILMDSGLRILRAFLLLEGP
jgi:hypothetical protein